MNMFARFDENPAMTLRVIKETKRYGRTDEQRENSIPPTNKVCGGYNYISGAKNGPTPGVTCFIKAFIGKNMKKSFLKP